MSSIHSWILNIVYAAIVVVASPWLLWRFIKGKSRRGWGQKLFGSIDPPTDVTSSAQDARELIWIHAVSVGEVNLLGCIIDEFRSRDPEITFAISTTTETGYDLAKSKYPESYLFFCPFDFTWAIKRVLKRLNPAALVLTELELWPNLIATADRLGVDVVVANGRLSEKSARGYGRMSWLLKSSFEKLSLVLCQSSTYADRFVSLGCDRRDVRVTGNVKFDHIETDRRNEATQKLVRLSGIDASEQVFLAGSTQLEEDLIAAKALQELAPEYPQLRLVLAPRHPQRVGELISRLEQIGIEIQLRSELESQHKGSFALGLKPEVQSSEFITQSVSEVSSLANASGYDNRSGQQESDRTSKPVLIIDVIGELGSWWGRADIAYVGGSMGSREGQNMIEPAGYGVPVSFGPRTKNFQELVNDLIANDAATIVKSQSELRDFVQHCLSDPSAAQSAGSRAQQVVLNHAGASARTVDAIFDLVRGTQGQAQPPQVSDAA